MLKKLLKVREFGQISVELAKNVLKVKIWKLLYLKCIHHSIIFFGATQEHFVVLIWMRMKLSVQGSLIAHRIGLGAIE